MGGFLVSLTIIVIMTVVTLLALSRSSENFHRASRATWNNERKAYRFFGWLYLFFGGYIFLSMCVLIIIGIFNAVR